MAYIGPFAFNAVRFTLGSLSLIPLIWMVYFRFKRYSASTQETTTKTYICGCLLAGVALFLGSSFQQIGIVYTTAGNAGFITGLYVILVPIMGMFWGQKNEIGTWLGAILALVGLYLLSVTGKFHISLGDFLVLVSAVFWAAHVHIISWFSRKIHPLLLAFMQFAVCAFLSLIAALLFEKIEMKSIRLAAIPILYAGLFSVGVAYTLQVVAQRYSPPANAAIILSLEAVFAVFGGWLILNEVLSLRGIVGCTLMFLGMLFSQMGDVSRFFRWKVLMKNLD